MVRVRFAPSPTGPLHIGGVRTALYNYLFARKQNGTYILRIEDTDQTRYVEGAEEYIIEALDWCGIKFDEGVREGGNYGPYRQSERKGIYLQYAELLVEKGDAYYAFDTREELERLRREYETKKKTFTYNGFVRNQLKNSLSLPEHDWKEMLNRGEPYVIRYRMPLDEEISFDDIIRGHIAVNSSTLDDKVLFKSDGMPTYHLANIVDDHLMEITHVIRGEEWLPSMPLHVMLYRSFQWALPFFAHLPLILKPDGKGKLSKRDGDKMGFPVYPIYWPYGETARGFREEGYYPEAFVNMLALLGWNPGTDKEIFSMEELINEFSLEKINKSGSRFDPVKARWFNHVYLQKRSTNQIALEFSEILKARGYYCNIKKLEILVDLVRERISFVKEMWDETSFFFEAPTIYDDKAVNKWWKEDSPKLLNEIADILNGISDFSKEFIEHTIRDWIARKGYDNGLVMHSLRIVLVGELKGPGIFDIISWLGKEETLRRIKRGIETIGK
ncbi:MAG TPA: glutamate--tRNA ligase [Bacteroidales bacterium]|nr:glutamate--tRNA ligase [Bacteroidales bacterium]HOU95192.1 glutamate--tRNA ligase [Bacteroidales bacterium]HQG35959.1 glutamate--tRNA ligase [Bacteroidales bacterium]HQG52977.1 glutamate--tRNA ligase [Bacteroidales bacterium]HQJ20798.1 glutamate--tRNA ligase [Bacteroidales bacterium]